MEVEILIKMHKHLSTGPPLPYGIYMSAMATSPDGNGVIIFGLSGTASGGASDGILELKSDGQGWVSTWTTLSAKLQYGRSSHVVIPLLMDKNICGLNGIVSANAGKYHNYYYHYWFQNSDENFFSLFLYLYLLF